MALSKVDLANQVENQLPQSLVADNVNFRNIIINGDMSIAQRGTSTASITSTGYYTVDRWNIEMSSAGTWTQSQDTDVPTGQGFSSSLKMDCTTADAAPAAGDYMILQQRFEGQNLQYLKKGTSSAESLTLSFWVKSVKTGTFIAELIDNDNSRTISKSYTINSASTWEKKTITYTGDTTGSFNNDNAYSLGLRLWLVAGSTYSGGALNTSWNSVTLGDLAAGQVNLADNTANNFWITGVQLEAGTTASDFEFLPYDVNLKRCLRYCYVITGATDQNIAIGDNANGTGTALFFLPLLTTMRSAPSGTFTTASDFEKLKYETGWSDLSSIALSSTQPFLYVIEAGSSQSDTRGAGTALRINNSSGKITLSSEL